MTTLSPEREITDPDIENLLSEVFDFDIACDISQLKETMPGYPPCKGDSARWVAWRTTGCCGKGPKYRLVCDHCKTVYQNWAAHNALISCPFCHSEVGGFASFTPLEK